MEILATAGTAAMSMFSAGASAIGSAASAVGGAVSSGASAMSSLSGGFSAMSGLASIGSGVVKMFGQKAAASDQRFQSRMEAASSGLQLAELKEERNRVIANNLVVASASGLDVTAGDPADAARAAEDMTRNQIEIENSNAAMRRYTRNRMASAAESKGWWSVFDGVVSAGKEMTSSRMQTDRRGVAANG